ncbi:MULTISPECIES: aminopeptidase [Solibacillus]|uniref:Aminopeptidase n=1 Tax=Solibacillus merdavium TaxID=2762218 RepID=A0ABR8XRE3_9BACL|nr:aminopeptidase [Solibacillus merdavium]MBD8034508.1 aminopeptidase [Solibacillus merdavium]
MPILQLEYRGLNLYDLVDTVEIAIDADLQMIHIYDTQQIVEPEYDFSTKSYMLSEGFWKMAKTIKEKQFFLENEESNLEMWITPFKWVFYSSNQLIKVFEDGKIKVHSIATCSEDMLLYEKYFSRLKGEFFNGK